MEFLNYIVENALVLVPALYIVGMFIKSVPKIPDWCIPFVLLVLGVAGAVGLMGPGVEAVIQGVLVTGAAVLVNQGVKQAGEAMEKDEG